MRRDAKSRPLSAALAATGGAAALAAVGWGAYAALTWSGYGKARHGRPNSLLDRFLPEYEVREQHQTAVAAPAATVHRTALALDFRRSPLARAVFRGRELLMGSRGDTRPAHGGLHEEMLSLGWRVLADEPGRAAAYGAVTQPWMANVQFRGLPPDGFAAFDEPGYAKIAWTIEVEPCGADRSIFRTETRVATTDAESRRRFRRYWAMVSPGVRLIRWAMLWQVRQEAEGEFTAARLPTGRPASPSTLPVAR